MVYKVDSNLGEAYLSGTGDTVIHEWTKSPLIVGTPGTMPRMDSHGQSQCSELRWTADIRRKSISAQNTDSDLGAELRTRTRLESVLTPASKPGVNARIIHWCKCGV